jgi:hypothetical protein
MNHQLLRLLVCTAFLAALLMRPDTAEAATATVKVAKVNGPAGKEAIVPIHVQSKDEMGCMQFALVYDPAILEVKTVEAGPFLPAGASVDHNKDQVGWLRSGFVCSPSKAGVKGEGAVLNVVFTVKGQVGQKSSLKLEKVRAWESTDPEILVQTEAGELTVVTPTTIPWLYIGIGAGVVVLLILLVMMARRGGRTAAPAPWPTAVPAAPAGAQPNAPGAPPRFAPEEPTFQHTCTKCNGVIRLPRSMVGQSFECAACGTRQVGGQ